MTCTATKGQKLFDQPTSQLSHAPHCLALCVSLSLLSPLLAPYLFFRCSIRFFSFPSPPLTHSTLIASFHHCPLLPFSPPQPLTLRFFNCDLSFPPPRHRSKPYLTALDAFTNAHLHSFSSSLLSFSVTTILPQHTQSRHAFLQFTSAPSNNDTTLQLIHGKDVLTVQLVLFNNCIKTEGVANFVSVILVELL